MKLLIYGAGGLAKEIYDLVVRSMPEKYEKIIFIDDFHEEGPYYLSESIRFESVISKFGDNLDEVEGVVGVGEPSYRKLLTEKFNNAGIKMTTLIDKTAIISSSAIIGDGTIICEMSTIHADVIIGKSALIQPYVDLGHDIVVNNYTVLGPHCAPGGGTIFGECVYTGMHSVIKEGLKIDDGAIVGMGSVVYKDVEAYNTVIGNPARVTKGNNEHRVFK